MKKEKGQAIDSVKSNKNNKKTKNNSKKNKNTKSYETINLSNEIIIGLTPKGQEAKKQTNKKKTTQKKKPKNKNNKKQKKQKKEKNVKKEQVSNNIIIKIAIAAVMLTFAAILFLKSSIFNIKEIKVENNSKITTEQIIKLSKIEAGMNMFSFNKNDVENKIKQNAYIESVNIKRSINGTVTLSVTERKPTYMLKYANAFVYINNQGYILEITETPLELPTISGFETNMEKQKEGNRLIIKDLEKLEDVIKIMTTAAETPVGKLISNIDITDSTNYKLTLQSENKLVDFGDTTNINVKLLNIQKILEEEQGVSGEIYFQDADRTVFKENV